MKHLFKPTMKYRLILFVLLITFGSMPNLIYSIDNNSVDTSLQTILNYPIIQHIDLVKVMEQYQLLRSSGQISYSYWSSPNFMAELEAFTSLNTLPGEQILIVDFNHTKDPAIIKLRNEVHLPPPNGGAIVRIYGSKEIMPLPIQSLFQGHIQGITRWCRFIAVNAEHKSPDEIADIISHELVHAYIASVLGFNNNQLPRWFNEGVALYLTDAKDQYITPEGYHWQRISRTTDEYGQYRLQFRYLEHVLGRQGVMNFILEVVQGQSIDLKLDHAGFTNENDLQNRASQWRTTNQNRIAGFGIALLVFIIIGFWGVMKRKQKRVKRMIAARLGEIDQLIHNYDQIIENFILQDSSLNHMIETNQVDTRIQGYLEKKALALIAKGNLLVKLNQRAEAENLYHEALQIAGWSVEITEKAQQAKDELEGMVV